MTQLSIWRRDVPEALAAFEGMFSIKRPEDETLAAEYDTDPMAHYARLGVKSRAVAFLMGYYDNQRVSREAALLLGRAYQLEHLVIVTTPGDKSAACERANADYDAGAIAREFGQGRLLQR